MSSSNPVSTETGVPALPFMLYLHNKDVGDRYQLNNTYYYVQLLMRFLQLQQTEGHC